ncbi:hypothetical protein COL154_008426 [Colletotrichum chrysophilum]|uniref:uncharacterized protein n=1 Tax=Colletotrichum chrysophilum TaxID=1836956 RepID=UPI002301BB22|nr:uncharacterized protein COL26b_007049 [Colletotrichum chrysophilum]KAJ0359280.1 hypothetical protein COL154_008426 [Colletotrichum chrysophilum]KAJ0374728.1 hypothetical protein COL26b_007049 [Colletotrichum chrysophilum]
MSFANIYTHRKVAENAAKGCDVCYRATSSVLVADEKKVDDTLTVMPNVDDDFFYVCPSHLKDKNFCSPIIDKEAVEAKKKKEIEDEIERVKKEYEEKQKKKEKDEKDKNTDKEKDKEKEKEKDKDEKKADDEKKDDDSKAAEKDGAGTETPSTEEEPRVFALHK